jgi:phage baseplate assembly protein W
VSDVVHFRHPLAVDPTLGRLATETDQGRHIDQMVRQVLLTSPGERVNRPDFGCGIRRMLFAPNNSIAATLAQVAVFEALDTWLGHVITVDRVEVVAEDETAIVTVVYTIRRLGVRRYLNVDVEI